MPVSTVDTTRGAASWVAGFTEGWRAPAGPKEFADHFVPMFTSDVRMSQPQLPTTHGIDEFRRGFVEPTFVLMPDIRAEVHRWAADGDVVYIDFTLHGTLAGDPISWPCVDRVTLRDGLATERVAYFDPAPLMQAIIRHPRAWPRVLRSQLMALRFRLARRRSHR